MSMPSRELVKQVKLQEELLTRQAAQSLRAYVQQAWPVLEPDTPFLGNWHIDLLVEHLEEVTAGRTTRLLITLPPRYMKSLLVSVLWPTWEWSRHPSRRWLFASYAESLALKHSLDRRTVLQSDWFQRRWGDHVRLASDQNVKGEFLNTERGVMIATSVGGSVTGRGGNRIVVDDLHNPLQAESDAQRETALTYFRQTLSTRLDDKKAGAIVVVMQRLHEHDVAALCEEFGYMQVRLPAEAETRTEIVFPRSGRIVVRERGDLLWPEREGRAELEHQRRLLGSAAYAGQYQQCPVPAGGFLIKRDWFRFYNALPPEGTWMQSWDMTFKDSPSGDYVVGLVAMKAGADIYLVDRVKGQWTFTQTCDRLTALYRQYPDTEVILVEEAANGPAVINMLGRQVPCIVGVTPQGGKVARAQAAEPLIEAGNVWLPNPRPFGQLQPEREWVDDFIDQCCVFPKGAHDDDVDAFSQLVARCLIPELPSFVTW
jgi:predicted phage terminase large subunit-like protein